MRRSFCLQYEYGHIEWIFICYGKTYDDRVCVTILIRRHFCPFSLPVSVLCFRFFLFLFVVCWIQFDSLVLCPWHMHKTPSKCCSLKKSLAHYCFFSPLLDVFSSLRMVFFLGIRHSLNCWRSLIISHAQQFSEANNSSRSWNVLSVCMCVNKNSFDRFFFGFFFVQPFLMPYILCVASCCHNVDINVLIKRFSVGVCIAYTLLYVRKVTATTIFWAKRNVWTRNARVNRKSQHVNKLVDIKFVNNDDKKLRSAGNKGSFGVHLVARLSLTSWHKPASIPVNLAYCLSVLIVLFISIWFRVKPSSSNR